MNENYAALFSVLFSVITTKVQTASVCEKGVTFEKKCYWIEEKKVIWNDALRECQNVNPKAGLAIVNAEAIMKELPNLLPQGKFKTCNVKQMECPYFGMSGKNDGHGKWEWHHADGKIIPTSTRSATDKWYNKKFWFKSSVIFGGTKYPTKSDSRTQCGMLLKRYRSIIYSNYDFGAVNMDCSRLLPVTCEVDKERGHCTPNHKVPTKEDPRKPFIPVECRTSKDDENKRNAKPSVCDKGVYLKDTCYWVEYEKVQWREALFQCQKVNAHARLAKVNAKDIKEEVKKLFREGDFAACNDKGEECPFIGMNEAAEGHWHYVDGTNVTREEKKSLWFQRPDNGDRRGKCGVFYGKAFNYTLGDADCYIPAPVICQVSYNKELIGPNRTIPESQCKGIIIGEKCYWVEHFAADFPGALIGCKRQKAQLAIFNKENRKYLFHLAEKSGSNISYIGLMENPNDEDKWKNIDQTIFDLSLFRKNEPNGNETQNCGTIDKYEGTYGVADRMCEPKRKFICERQVDNSTHAPPLRSETEQVLCARGIIHRGRCYWIETGKRNWYDAETYCNTLNSNAHLAKINSVEVRNAIEKLIPINWNTENHIYFGANDIDNDGDLRHIDGTKVTLKELDDLWQNKNDNGREENCGVVQGFDSGGHKFGDVSCDFLRPFMCEVPEHRKNWATPVAKPDDIEIVNDRPSICDKGVTVGNKCYWLELEKVQWGQAMIKCQKVNEYARLAKVNTELIARAIQRLLKRQVHLDLKQCDESGEGCPFIGMNHSAGDGDWRYVDGTKVTENEMDSLWHNRFVAAKERKHNSCGKVLGKSFEYRLGDGDCYKASPVICEVYILKRRCGPNLDNLPTQSLCQKGIAIGDKCYWIQHDPLEWSDSQKECKGQNPSAQLAIINTKETLKHLVDLLELSIPEKIYVGLKENININKDRWKNIDGTIFNQTLFNKKKTGVTKKES